MEQTGGVGVFADKTFSENKNINYQGLEKWQ
jgi:hypothetical protein